MKTLFIECNMGAAGDMLSAEIHFHEVGTTEGIAKEKIAFQTGLSRNSASLFIESLLAVGKAAPENRCR